MKLRANLRAGATSITVLLLAAAAFCSAQVITEYPVPPSPSGSPANPQRIVVGPDGNLWFTQSADFISRITTSGIITRFPARQGYGITVGPDTNLWFFEGTAKIGRITTSGTFTEFSAPGDLQSGLSIATGPDGNLWFTEPQVIERMAPAGVVTGQFAAPLPTIFSAPQQIVAGPDGALWFTEGYEGGVARLTTDGVVTDFPKNTADSWTSGITVGPDGALWFLGGGGLNLNLISRISTAGVMSNIPFSPSSATAVPGPTPVDPNETGYIALGPDGNLWVSGSDYYSPGLWRITPTGVFTLYRLPAGSSPLGLTAGPDGNIWYADNGASEIGKLALPGPRITSVSSPNSDGAYGPGADIAITITFDSPVIVTGTPLLPLNSGGTAIYSSGGGTNMLTFTYTVGTGESTTGLDVASYMGLVLNLNGATIRDTSGTPAILTIPVYPRLGALADNKQIFITPASGCTLPFCVLPLQPNSGGNNGTFTTQISGAGFIPGATVRLSQSGQSDIIASPANVTQSGTAIAVTFDLNGAALGPWDVVVTNPDGSHVTLPDGFTVIQGTLRNVWLDILGPTTVRFGTTVSFGIIVGNRGTVDATFVPATIDFSPYVSPALGFTLTPPGIPSEYLPIDWGAIPAFYSAGGRTVLSLYLPLIPPGQKEILPITLTIPQAGDPNAVALGNSFTINTEIGEPIVQSTPAQDWVECVAGLGDLALTISGVGEEENCATTIAGLIPGITVNGIKVGAGEDSAVSFGALVSGIAVAAAECGGEVFPELRIFDASLQVISTASSCVHAVHESFFSGSVVVSLDPNNKFGSIGSGPPQYLSGDEPLRYVIDFENQSTATAPAQQVTITDQLDLTKVDPSTFSFGPIAFGSKQVVPSRNFTEFAADVDLRPAQSLIARIGAKLDSNTGLVTWRFASIDPATGQPTTDPIAGFLPPNTISPQGQGNVLFTVMPRADVATGTQIMNQASIVFDSNAPINTQQWLNTIDNSKPSSQVLTLPATEGSTSFIVQWSGTDVGSGIGTYTIYSSENGGPFNVWLQNTTGTSGTFTGTAGSSYAFYSIARDLAGNLEAPKTASEATTSVVVDTTPPVITPAITGKQGQNGWYISSVTVSWSVTDPESGIASSTGCSSAAVTSSTPGATFTCSAANNAGLSGTSTVNLKVDLAPPVLSLPSPINVTASTSAGAVVSYTTTAADNLDPNPTVSCVPVSGSTFAVGSTVVTCMATDAAGNQSTGTFTITVSPPATGSADLALINLTSPIVNSGKQLTYLIAAANLGPNTARSVAISDSLPAGTTLVSAVYAVESCTTLGGIPSCPAPASKAQCASAGDQVTCNIGDLPVFTAKQPAGVGVLITVQVSAPAGTKLVDTARISSLTTDPRAGNNVFTAVSTVTR